MSASLPDSTRAVVTLTERRGRESVEVEVQVSTLGEMYAACLRAAPGTLVRVHLFGSRGELRLDFASLIHPAK